MMKTLAVLIFAVITSSVVAQSSIPECDTSLEVTSWHNCFGPKTYPNGGKYLGQFKDGRKHGLGTYTSNNGDKYLGEWKDGKANGQGIVTYADGRAPLVGIWANHQLVPTERIPDQIADNRKNQSPPSNHASSGVSHGICSSWERVMKTQTLNFRQMGVPIGDAQRVYSSERDTSTRVFLRRVVRDLYQDPVSIRDYLDSGRFLNDCIRTHRGF